MRSTTPLFFALVLSIPSLVFAHGSMTTPPSRVYTCAQGNIENPTDPACKAATQAAGTQQFYDWMSINQANANSNHTAVVPDGKLCSGGNATFRGLDLARTDWQATPIAPDANGRFEFVFRGTAPHATKDWIFYVTREGWDGTQPLRWSDLFEFCRLGNVPLSTGGVYRLNCPLPQSRGRHVIYNAWQRSDSTEAFYTCVDVVFPGGNTSWVDEGPVTGQNALATGTTVTLRLFNAAGNDVERIEHVVAAGQGAAAQWPYQFALTVNARSQRARVGRLDGAGNIDPVQAASGNRVYTRSADNLNHQIDIRAPDTGVQPPVAAISASATSVTGAGSVNLSAAGSSNPSSAALTYNWRVVSGVGTLTSTNAATTTLQLAAPAQDQTVTVAVTVANSGGSDDETVAITHRASGGGTFDYVYPAGIGSYVPGTTVVKGSDGLLYRCRPFPQGQWCNINSAFHYAPGTGTNWQDAWIRL